MAGDEYPAVGRVRRAARQDGEDVTQFGLLVEAVGFGDGVGVKADLQARAETFELVKYPLPRRADPAFGLGGIGGGMARFKFSQPAHDVRHALLGNLRHDFLDDRIQCLGRTPGWYMICLFQQVRPSLQTGRPALRRQPSRPEEHYGDGQQEGARPQSRSMHQTAIPSLPGAGNDFSAAGGGRAPFTFGVIFLLILPKAGSILPICTMLK